MIVGFTGTRDGMTQAQKCQVECLLLNFQPQTVHHGDCIGADADFSEIVVKLNHARKLNAHIVGHPCNLHSQRAHCIVNEERPVLEPRERNQNIVNESGLIIVTPREFSWPKHHRSGTWMTCGIAKNMHKRLMVVWPDGTPEIMDFRD